MHIEMCHLSAVNIVISKRHRRQSLNVISKAKNKEFADFLQQNNKSRPLETKRRVSAS